MSEWSRADELWLSYLKRTGGISTYREEPEYRYRLDTLRDQLRLLAMILEDEQISPEQADRILRSFLYGGPTVSDAEQRLRDQKRLAELLSTSPIRPIPLGGILLFRR